MFQYFTSFLNNYKNVKIDFSYYTFPQSDTPLIEVNGIVKIHKIQEENTMRLLNRLNGI